MHLPLSRFFIVTRVDILARTSECLTICAHSWFDMKFVSASIVGVVSASKLQALVDEVNSKQNSWTAAVPSKFSDEDDVKNYLGAYLPGDPEYNSPPVRYVDYNVTVPDSFDATEQWPQCTVLSWVRDQSACGCCWAFASASTFEGRACIAGGGDIRCSAEDVCFCSSAGNGCGGGNSAWSWMSSSGVVTGGDYKDTGSDRWCYPSVCQLVPTTWVTPPKVTQNVLSKTIHRLCVRGSAPKAVNPKSYSADKVRAASSYSVRGISQMQQEIMTNGPLWVGFSVYADFPLYKSGVYRHTSGAMKGGHAVTMVGWGEDNGQK